MRKTSFDSVPEPAFRAVADLYGATQQLALALLVTTPEIAQAAVAAWGAPKVDSDAEDSASTDSDVEDADNFDDNGSDRPSAEALLEWAESMRDEMNFASCVKSLVRQCPPLMNTHPGFIQGPLDAIPYPGWVDLALYGLVESICNDALAGKLDFLAHSDVAYDAGFKATRKREDAAIVDEMVRRGIPHPCSASERVPLDRERCEAFMKRREVYLFVLTCGTIRMMQRSNKDYPTQDDRKMYLIRSRKDGRTALVRARSEAEAESAATQTLGNDDVRSVEIDFDTWVVLGGD
jgi:hypothetical protein